MTYIPRFSGIARLIVVGVGTLFAGSSSIAEPAPSLSERLKDAPQEERSAIIREYRAEGMSERSAEEWRNLPEEEKQERREAMEEATRQRNERREERRRERELFSQFSDEEKMEYVAERMRRIRERRAASEPAAHLKDFLEAPESLQEQGSARPESYIDQWQLQSITSVRGVNNFSLHNPWKKRSFWAGLGEERHDIRIVGYNPNERALEIEHEGELRRVFLGGVGGTATADLFDLARDPANWRKEFQEVYSRWQEFTQDSPDMAEIDRQYDRIARAIRDNQQRMRELARDESLEGTERGERMRELIGHNASLFSEAEKLTEELVAGLRESGEFDSAELNIAEKLTWPMLFSKDL